MIDIEKKSDESTDKVYGASILEDYVIKTQNSSDDSSNFEKIDESNIQEMKEELIEADGNNPTVTAKTATDVLSGMTASSVISDDADLDVEKRLSDVEENINNDDIRGKTLPNVSFIWIKRMFNHDLNEDETNRIVNYLDSLGENYDFEEMSINDLSNMRYVFAGEIAKTVKGVSETDDDEISFFKRIISELYRQYYTVTGMTDDMRELAKIARNVRNSLKAIKKSDVNISEVDESNIDEAVDKASKLSEASENITNYLEKKKNMDERNRRLRPNYSIDDVDTRTMENIRDCLNDALEMNTIYNYISNSGVIPLKKEFKSRVKDKVIEDWIDDIRNDPNVIYTLPANDFEDSSITRKEVSDYIFNAILSEFSGSAEIPDECDDLEEYLTKNEFITEQDGIKFRICAEAILYIISKTFKYKKLENERNRRVLSYTLDMLSKLSIEKSYRKTFLDLGEYLYSTII